MQVITIHSYKGGTGKTNLSLNLAVSAANRAKRVALLELDLESPAIYNTFKNTRGKWMNDFLEKDDVKLKDILTDVSMTAKTKGALEVGLANPEMSAVRKSIGGDRKEQLKGLKRLMSIREELKGYDYVFFDTSPGVTYASINAVLTADRIILVAKSDRFDIEGTDRLIAEFYEGLEKKTGLVVNRVLTPQMTQAVTEKIKIPLLASIPCYCEVPIAGSHTIFVNDKPGHPYSQNIEELLERTLAF
ncbi:MAG: MinD/ParA family protein [Euryarchaeota archaeon]|nr:MinD/ParA family protein [Euryarchaeota archaeon]